MARKPLAVRTRHLGCTWAPISVYIKVEGNDTQAFVSRDCFKECPSLNRYIQSSLKTKEERGKQRIKMRFYESLKSTRPLQVEILYTYMKAKTTVALLFAGNS